MQRNRFIFTPVLIFLSIFFTEPVYSAQVEAVSVTLTKSVDPADAGLPIVVVTITNNGESPVTLNRYHLPFNWDDGLPNNQFEIHDTNGFVQKYVGKLVHVTGSDSTAFTQLPPHQSLSGRVELWRSYRFDTQVVNTFTVSFSMPLGIVAQGNELDPNAPDYDTNPNRFRSISSNVLQISLGSSAQLAPLQRAAAIDAVPEARWIDTTTG